MFFLHVLINIEFNRKLSILAAAHLSFIIYGERGGDKEEGIGQGGSFRRILNSPTEN
jgi:hypothetical protein